MDIPHTGHFINGSNSSSVKFTFGQEITSFFFSSNKPSLPGVNAQGGGYCENGVANGTNPVYDPRCRKWYVDALTSQGINHKENFAF